MPKKPFSRLMDWLKNKAKRRKPAKPLPADWPERLDKMREKFGRLAQMSQAKRKTLIELTDFCQKHRIEFDVNLSVHEQESLLLKIKGRPDLTSKEKADFMNLLGNFRYAERFGE